MRIAIRCGDVGDVEQQVEAAVDAERDGFDGISYGGAFGMDPLMVVAMAAQKTSRIELSTSVVPTYPRHPVVMAAQALTAQAASRGRFTLGIGLSHAPIVEGLWGMSYERPALHLREYLSILQPLLQGGSANFSGHFFKVNQALQIPRIKEVPILVAALGPVMLRITGEMAHGTVTWMVGRKTLETHIVPRIRAAAQAAGRPEPRVMVGLHIAVTDDAAEARQRFAGMFQVYRALPSYQRMLEIEGASHPAEVAVVGTEEEVERELRALAAVGATDFLAQILPAGPGEGAPLARTRGLLKSLIGKI